MINNTMLASISSRHILRKYQHFTAGNETTSVSAALKLLFIVNMLRNKLFCLYHFVYFLHAAVVITISITTRSLYWTLLKLFISVIGKLLNFPLVEIRGVYENSMCLGPCRDLET